MIYRVVNAGIVSSYTEINIESWISEIFDFRWEFQEEATRYFMRRTRA